MSSAFFLIALLAVVMSSAFFLIDVFNVLNSSPVKTGVKSFKVPFKLINTLLSLVTIKSPLVVVSLIGSLVVVSVIFLTN